MKIPAKVVLKANQIAFKANAKSPEILMGVGIVSILTGTVLACKATLKLDDVLDEAKTDINLSKKKLENPEILSKPDEQYNKKDKNRDVAKAYGTAAWKTTKIYLPSAIAISAGVVCIIGGHNILSKRNAALVAAYNTMDQSYRDYRKSVENPTEFIEDIKEDAANDVITSEMTKGKGYANNDIDDETRKRLKCSVYAKVFDESSSQWDKSPEYNLTFLKFQEQYATDRLQTTGHLFLNDVYCSLGMPDTQAGAIVGWVLNTEADVADNYVDFGLHDIINDINGMKRDFINGTSRYAIVDFNVQGVIYDLI